MREIRKRIDAVRTVNNQLVLGEVLETAQKVTIVNPISVVPTKEGLTLIPYDIDILGVKLSEVDFEKLHVLYVVHPSDQLIEEYHKVVEGVPAQPETPVDPETGEDSEAKPDTAA